ncbi:uncharacterized protein LOC108674539 isoform X1 [Hyalella azteca]|uniref:Uncharacterized protein LOC108674539 isoform X1 n=1 Tax=Hyalella azteca TaxID=294128 RepID=A0A979FNM0_HYAAZ|nr:uncharacterized protein LOC108674539 isoform X1 [Hyalella azteca]
MQQKNLQEVMGPNQMLPRKDGTEKSSGFTSLSGRTSQHKQSLGWSDAREEEVTLQPTHAEVAQPHQFASSQVEVTQASQFSSEQMHEPQKHDENGNTPEEESMADDDWYRKSDKPQSRDGFVLHHQEQMQQKRQELQQVLKEQMLQHEQTCQEEAPLPSCAMQQHLEEQQQQKMLAQQQRMRSFEDKLCRGELPPSSPGEKLSHEHNVDAPASNNAPSSQEREYQMRTSGNVSSEASANSSVTYDMDTTSVAMTASPIATSSPLIAPVSYANGSLSCGSSPHAAYPLSQSLGSSPHIPSTRPNFYTRGAPHPYYETRTMPDHQTRPMADHQTRPMLDRQTRPISDHQTRPMTDHQTRPMSDHQSHSISDHQTRPMSDHQARPMPDHQIRPMSDHQAHSMSDHQARPKPDHQTRPTPGHSFANNFQSPDASSHVIAGNTYTSGGNFHTSSGISYSSGGIPYASGINSLITGSFSHIPGTNARMFSSNSHVPATSGYGSAGHFDMLPSPPYLNPMMSANGSAATSLSSSTLNLMKKQITEIEREIALRKPDPSYVAGSSRHGDLPAGPVSSTLDLQLLDPLNDKMGEPPPPPAPHPHRGGGAILENGTLPQHKSSVLHSPHYTPTCDGALLLSSLGPITSPGLPPSGLPSSSAPPASGQDPSSCTAVNESAGHKRESVAAAIADIKQAIRRTKNLPLKSAADRNNVGPDTPVWVPRASRRSDGPVLGSPSDGPVPLSPTSSSGGTCNHVENGPARPDQRHDEDDGDTDQETDRLLGQQRAEDHGYGAPDKAWRRSKPRCILPRSGNLANIINSSSNNSVISNSSTTNSCNISTPTNSCNLSNINSSSSSNSSVSNMAPPCSPSIVADGSNSHAAAAASVASNASVQLMNSSSSSSSSTISNNNGSLTNVSGITNVSGLTNISGLTNASNLTNVSALTNISDLTNTSNLMNVSNLTNTNGITSLGSLTAENGAGIVDRDESDNSDGSSQSSKSPRQVRGSGRGESPSTAPSTPINQCGSRDDSTSTPTGPCGSQDENSTPPLGQGESQDGSSPSATSPEVTVNGKTKAKKEKEAAKKKGRSKEVVVHEPAVLIEGVLFRARYLGSTQLVSEGQPTKTTRMMQAEEAVTRIKEAEDPDENMTMRKSDSESSTVKTTPSLLPRNASSDRTATTIRELSGVGMFPSGEVSAIICEPFESESCILQAEPNETNINLPQDDPAGDTRNSEDQDKENCTTNSSNELRDGLNDINDIDDDRDEVIDEENEEKTENDVMEHQEPVEQYNPPKYTSATYKPKSQYPQNRNIPEILRIQEELLPGEEKQTLHERFSKLQEFKNKSMVISALPRVSSSPSKKSISIPREYRRSPKQPLVYDADPYMLDSRFKTTHLWKTQAKISTGGIAGTSVITVPCDGKANLLGVKSAPLKSPLPPGVLEEPISPSRNKLDIHGQLLDFIEERNAAANSKLHKHLLHFLPDKKIKNLKERSGTQDELQMLTEPQPDEDGVMLYEEDSNDGMDRKLQEFDDDIIEEEEEEEEEDRKDNGTTANVGRAMAEDAENGNLADAIASVGRNGVRPSEALQHSPNTDISSDDNDFSEQDDNCNNKDTKNVRDLGDNCETDKDDDSATDVSYSRNDVGKKTDNEVRPPESRTRGSNIRQGSVGNVAWIVDGVGGIGATGTVFHLRLVGSVEVSEERCDVSVGSKNITTTASANPGKRPRKEMVTEAVSKLKALAPDGENQPNTEVDLFISTEKIMVLNTDLKEIMMDHALRTISYIADIGDLVVLMARRRMLPTDDTNSLQKQPKMICHVFESDEAQFIAQSIGQAFQVAYLEFLKANGIEDHSFVKEMDYQEVLNSQEIFGDELQMFAKKELQKEVVVPKMKSEILGVVVVESGWGSMVPTVVIANLSPYGAAAKCGQLNIGDQIIAINGVSLVGLPLSTCQNYIKNTKYNTAVKLTVVPCPPVVEVKIRRPDTKYQLGFSVQNGVICSLLRGGIAERGGVRVGHRIIDINSQSVVAVPHEKIVNLLATSVGEIRMKTMPTSIFRLLTGQETPQYI